MENTTYQVTDEEYVNALNLIHKYRIERDLYVALPINTNNDGNTISMDQFKLYQRLKALEPKPNVKILYRYP